MTLTPNFAMVGWDQYYKGDPSETYPLGSAVTAWMPTDIAEE